MKQWVGNVNGCEMAQITQTPLPRPNYQSKQVSQILVHGEELLIDINYDVNNGKVIIVSRNNWYYLESPDITNLTIKNVIDHLGYANHRIDITWVQNGFAADTLLNTPIKNAPLNQIDLYYRD